jgi:hypothetical protein
MNFSGYLLRVRKTGRWAMMFVAGPCLLVAALVTAINTALFLHRSQAAPGVVVSLRTVESSDGDAPTYAPVFSFTADGIEHTISSHSSSNPPEFRVGQKIQVRYEPRYPDQARIDSHWQIWAFSDVFAAVGTGFLLLGFLAEKIEGWRARRRLARGASSAASVQ